MCYCMEKKISRNGNVSVREMMDLQSSVDAYSISLKVNFFNTERMCQSG